MAYEFLFANNATTTLAQSISATATVITVASGGGDLFPSPASGQAFAITLVDAETGLTNEICYCTSRSGDELTVVRGQEGKNAIAWSAGDTCANYITANVIESWLQEGDLDGYLTETAGNSRYIQSLDSGDDLRVNRMVYRPSASAPFIDGFTGAPFFFQRQGDYATNTALSSEAARAQGAEAGLSNSINQEVARAKNAEAGLSSSISQETTRAQGVEGSLNTSISSATYTANTAYSLASAAVSGGNTSGGQKRGETLYLGSNGYPTFAYEGGGDQLALLSDFANGGTGSSGYYITVRNTMIQQFVTVGITATAQWITFPVSFSGNPAPPTGNVYGENDQDTQIYGATALGCYVRCPSTTSNQGQPVSIIVMGPV